MLGSSSRVLEGHADTVVGRLLKIIANCHLGTGKHKKAPCIGASCAGPCALLALGPFARRMARFIYKNLGYRDRQLLGWECPGDAVAVEVDQVPAVCSLRDQVAVYAFWF